MVAEAGQFLSGFPGYFSGCSFLELNYPNARLRTNLDCGLAWHARQIQPVVIPHLANPNGARDKPPPPSRERSEQGRLQ